jgi:glycosyltransferase involved in cell wall biosynthesis
LADRLWFAIPGDIETRTGGTIYDKKVMAELRAAGWEVGHLRWPASFPFPSVADAAVVAASLAACPDGALVLIDGLAFGVLPELAAAEARRLRLVALVHHPLALESGLAPDIAERLTISEQRALTHVRAVVVTSEITAATLERDYGVNRSEITVATPGIDRPDPLPPRPSNTVPHLLAVGTVSPRKGYDILIDGLARIADLDWHCAVAGSLKRAPETVAEIRQQIARHALTDRVALIGEVPDPTPLYEKADIFVLPSRYEGYGMAIAEALAHGIPVVATRVGAIPEVVPEDAGILVPVDDPEALAESLRRLIAYPAVRREFTDKAVLAASRFARWRDTADRIASALRAIQ